MERFWDWTALMTRSTYHLRRLYTTPSGARSSSGGGMAAPSGGMNGLPLTGSAGGKPVSIAQRAASTGNS